MSRFFLQRRAVPGVLVAVLLMLSGRAMPADATVPLTALDYIQIQQLVNRLNFALDYCSSGGKDFSDLFVDDGRYVIDNGDGKPRTFSGREQLTGMANGPSCKTDPAAPRPVILHTAESLVIEATLAGASGTSYAIYPSDKGKYAREDIAGQVGLYRDEFVRTANGWRFKSRTHESFPARGGKSPIGSRPGQ
ncbi:MAG: hypothetical protein RL030_1214 [Pseudomonadota bacterium]